jgi:hypothetical protein
MKVKKIEITFIIIFLIFTLILAYPSKALLNLETLVISDILLLFNIIIAIFMKNSYKKIDKYYLIIVSVMFISILIKGFSEEELYLYFKGIRTNFLYVLIYIIPFIVKFRKNDIEKTLKILMVLSVIINIYAIKQLVFGYSNFEINWLIKQKGANYNRILFDKKFSTLGSANVFALISSIGYIIFWFNQTKFKILNLIIHLIFIIGMSSSLMKILFPAMNLVYIVRIITDKEININIKIKRILTLFIILIAILILFKEKFSTIELIINYLLNPTKNKSNSMRFNLILRSLNFMLKNNKILTGINFTEFYREINVLDSSFFQFFTVYGVFISLLFLLNLIRKYILIFKIILKYNERVDLLLSLILLDMTIFMLTSDLLNIFIISSIFWINLSFIELRIREKGIKI